MQQLVNVKTKIETLPLSSALPLLLGVNTLALAALDAGHAIPGWIRTAASLFLLF
ncbi:MAG TPA: hypothetical protein VM557_08630 [Thermoanaerobaculia bacterium]|nr:hypothetical protein [Thermoanaerobaculia bacterium]